MIEIQTYGTLDESYYADSLEEAAKVLKSLGAEVDELSLHTEYALPGGDSAVVVRG